MAVVLDSDILSILQRRSEPACGRLEQRLSQLPDEEVFTTIVTFQEQMRGWLAALHKARSDNRLLLAYAELQSMLRDFCTSISFRSRWRLEISSTGCDVRRFGSARWICGSLRSQ